MSSEDSIPSSYPPHWDADVVLSDGGTVHVRPIRPDDATGIHAFHGRQSPESIYYRYFTPHPTLSAREVEHLTHVDYADRMAFVALRDDIVVGVARYDRWPTRSEADVAFFVDDAHRGRGLATLLLEYLAVRAREVGISRFTATVLPSNRRMVGVFRQAGFSVTSRFEDGLIEVGLDLQPTPEATAAIEARAQRAEAHAVELLMAPRSVAVVGASRRRGSVGHAVMRNLLQHEFAGPVYPVNRTAPHVSGVPAFASLDDIDSSVDLAIVCVPAAQVPEVIEQCGRNDVKAAIVISSGFAESGPEGEALSDATLRAARRFGVRVLGPNCLGVINTDPDVRLHATFATPWVHRGKVALLSESGTIGSVILEHMDDVDVGLSSFAAIGNRADISANDLLQYWADDERTSVVLLNLESFGNPRKFSRIARGLSRSKPVVAVRSGRSARAYPDQIREGDMAPSTVDAVLRQTGLIRVDTLGQLLDVGRVLAGQPLPAGPRVAVVGNTGGSLVTAADACVDAGLELARLSLGEQDAPAVLTSKLRDNPFDLGYLASADDLEELLRTILRSDAVDSALVVCAPSPRHATEDWVRAIEAARPVAPDKAMIVSILMDHPAVIAQDGEWAVPVFDFPDAAAYALGKVTRYALWRAEPEGKVVEFAGAAQPAEVRTVVVDALQEHGEGVLGPVAAVEVLRSAGLDPVPSMVVADVESAVAAAAELGYPVAVKALSRDPLAKTEAAGIAIDVHDEAHLRESCARLVAARGAGAFPAVVQPMVAPGVDVAIRVTQHHLVGPVVTLGPGGVAAPLSRGEPHVLPLTDLDARRLVAASPLAPLLGEGPTAHLEELLLGVGALVEAAPEITGLDLNPVIVSTHAAAIADARIRVAPEERDRRPPVRRL